MRQLTEAEVWNLFKERKVPVIASIEATHNDGRPDLPLRRESWNDYIDFLEKEKLIPRELAYSIAQPSYCNVG